MAKVELGKFINMLLSVFDKEFRAWAKKATEKVPKDSALRKNELVERGFDVFRGFLEKNVQFENVVAQAVKEKVVDVGDYLATSFFGREKADKKTAAAAQDWMKSFLVYAEKRISEAKSLEEMEVEFKRLEREFQLQKKIVDIIEAAAKVAEPLEPEVSPIEPIDWKSKFESLKKKWEEKWKPKIINLDNFTASHIRDFRKSLGWLRPKTNR